MFCALVGLVPPDPELAKHVQQHLRELEIEDHSVPIQWRSSYSLAPDQDQDSVMTMLLTAISDDPATPDSIVGAVEEVATKWWNNAHASSHNDTTEETVALSVELWASAPAPLPLCPLDGYDKYITTTTPTEDVDDTNNDTFCKVAKDAMQEWGLVHQPQILNATAVAEICPVINAAISSMEKDLALHQPQLTVGKDDFCFREIASRNQERFDLRLPTDPLTSPTGALVHKYILSNPLVFQFLQSTLGVTSNENTETLSSIIDNGEIDFDLSVVYSRPGAGAQGWHADGSHLPGAQDAGWDPNQQNQQLAHPYAVCLFVPLIDLNDTVGYTQFWPGSHQHRGLVGFGPVAQITSSVWNGSCPAGDGVWYDYRLLHQGMPNTSDDIVRPVLQIIFKRKWYVERANYGTESVYNNHNNTPSLSSVQ